MNANTDTLVALQEKYPNVSEGDLALCLQYGGVLNNTGGNPPEELLNDYYDDVRFTRLFKTNVVRYLLATAVASQITLLRRLTELSLLVKEES